MPMNLALKIAILHTGKTQADIAERLGISQTVMSQIVRGRVVPSEAEQKAIARALKVPISQIFPAQQVA